MEALLRWQISSPRKVDQREREVQRRPTRGSGTHIPTQPQSYCLGYSQVDLVVVKVKVTQLCPAVCNPMDYTVHGILRPEYWSGQPFPSPGDLPNPGIKPRSPALQGDYLPSQLPGKPKNTGVGNLSLLQGNFLTQESTQGLLHCRHIFYQLSYFMISCVKGFPGSSAGKQSAYNAGDPSSIPGLRRSTGEGIGYPLQYSQASLVAQLVNSPPALQETWV